MWLGLHHWKRYFSVLQLHLWEQNKNSISPLINFAKPTKFATNSLFLANYKLSLRGYFKPIRVHVFEPDFQFRKRELDLFLRRRLRHSKLLRHSSQSLQMQYNSIRPQLPVMQLILSIQIRRWNLRPSSRYNLSIRCGILEDHCKTHRTRGLSMHLSGTAH